MYACNRVRTLTGKEIELDIEADYKVHPILTPLPGTRASVHRHFALPLSPESAGSRGFEAGHAAAQSLGLSPISGRSNIGETRMVKQD